MSQVVIHSVTLFDGETVRQDATVIFNTSSGLIESVSCSSEKPDSSTDTTIIDGNGHTLLPGLIDAHMHCHGLHLQPGQDASSVLQTPLKSGVTTVCDMHSPPDQVKKLRSSITQETQAARKQGKDGKVTMADLKSSLLGATIKDGWPKPIVLGGHPTDEVRLKTSLPMPIHAADRFSSLGQSYGRNMA